MVLDAFIVAVVTFVVVTFVVVTFVVVVVVDDGEVIVRGFHAFTR